MSPKFDTPADTRCQRYRQDGVHAHSSFMKLPHQPHDLRPLLNSACSFGIIRCEGQPYPLFDLFDLELLSLLHHHRAAARPSPSFPSLASTFPWWTSGRPPYSCLYRPSSCRCFSSRRCLRGEPPLSIRRSTKAPRFGRSPASYKNATATSPSARWMFIVDSPPKVVCSP